MAAQKLPEQSVLFQLLDADLDAGTMVWKSRPRQMFASDRSMASWNASNAGNIALASIGRNGYLRGTLLGVPVYAHRVLWKMMFGTEPEIIDHINMVQTDNRMSNLRAGTRSLNALNVKRIRGRGTWESSHKTGFYAKLGEEYLGLHKTRAQAIEAYQSALSARMSAWEACNAAHNPTLDGGNP